MSLLQILVMLAAVGMAAIATVALILIFGKDDDL